MVLLNLFVVDERKENEKIAKIIILKIDCLNFGNWVDNSSEENMFNGN